ncbi:Y-family DNA polymerase [Caballeronia humi]|uniref:DNA polymerase n=1 Tax=Caballeronia humi TaxID=326474 RepID=A0A158J1V7_9BURK|nr:DNA polymerase Y family protein [Caballeronia humi]SAL62359.1 DNA polymerase [Caballeronia humi]
MAVLVAIHLPRLSLEVFRPRWSPRTANGCVVLDKDKVAIADAVAREAGVLLGMKRGGVVTLAPDALVYDRAPVREQDMLREVALALMRFSPMVAVCEEDTVVVDVSASLRLFGGILRICHQIRQIVDAVGVSVRMSVAPTGQGAWMLAKRGHRRVLKMRSLERERLVVQLCGWLSAQQLALTHASVTLEHERGREAIEPTTIDLALAEPTWHEEHLVRLLKERLGRVELPAAVIAVRLTATKVQAAEPPTDTLFPDPGGSAEDHNRLLELLVARLGPENVLRPAPTSDHRPEHANRWVSVSVSVQDAARPEAPPCDLPRPTWLLETPLRLMVKNHRPFYGSTLKLVSTGERIEAGWFDGDLAARDYFVAEAADKSCYWIYRERPSATSDEVRWFLHGLFG